MTGVHKVIDVLGLGLHSLVVHKVRSALTVVGILFGVWSVIAMLAINEGLSIEAQRALRELGSDNIIVDSVKPPAGEAKAGAQQWGIMHYGLTREDVVRLRDNIPDVVRCVITHRTLKKAYANGTFGDVSVIATEPTYADVSRIDMLAGRFFRPDDLLRAKPHCVLTQSLAETFFVCADPLGQVLRIGSHPFVVVGIIRQLPAALAVGSGSDVGNHVLIPISADRMRFGKFTVMFGQGGSTFEKVEISQIILQMKDEEAVINGSAVARNLLGRYHAKRDYEIRVPIEEIKVMRKNRRLWTLMFTAIAAVSLLVGGIGIMNIMLASVTERTREIGIRRALGARKRDIVVQFLIEAVTLTALGGVLGIAVGIMVPWAVEQILGVMTVVTAMTMLLPLVMAATVGLISGLYPAIRAAKLDPIAALRHE